MHGSPGQKDQGGVVCLSSGMCGQGGVLCSVALWCYSLLSRFMDSSEQRELGCLVAVDFKELLWRACAVSHINPMFAQSRCVI